MAARFNVFGKLVVVERHGGDWRAYYSGGNGTRRLADFVIPADVEEDCLEQYLGDLFHENARPNHAEVTRLD